MTEGKVLVLFLLFDLDVAKASSSLDVHMLSLS